jgi:S-formylglutathione hydrolase FrmB
VAFVSFLRPGWFTVSVSLLLAWRLSYGARTQTLTIPSPSMGKSYKATVIVPDAYATSGKRYSVIYFLHGFSQDYSVWPKVAALGKYADTYRMILVCPDGNYNSWYIDSPVRRDSRFETYVAVEVPAFIDSAFRTNASLRGRGLVGSSMGGYGAMAILLKHQGRFAAASSISGILDLTAFPGQWDLESFLGPYKGNEDLWKRYSVTGIIDSLSVKDRGIFIDCGVSDFALQCARSVHERLVAAGVPHQYREGPGGHTPRYVKNAAEFHILFMAQTLQGPQR